MNSIKFGRRVIELFGAPKKEVNNLSESIIKLNEKKVEEKKANVDYSKFEELQKGIQHLQDAAKTQKHQANEWQRTAFHDHGKDLEIYEKTNEQKLEAMEKFKQLGNRQIQKQDFQKASYYYAQALLYHVYLIPDTPQEVRLAKDLQIKCRLNQALAFQKQERHKDALNQIEMVIRIDPRNIKAYFRQVNSLIDLDRLDEAREILRKARALHPDDPHLFEQQNQVKRLTEERKERDRKSAQEFSQSLHYQPKTPLKVVQQQQPKARQEEVPPKQQEAISPRIREGNKTSLFIIAGIAGLIISMLISWLW